MNGYTTFERNFTSETYTSISNTAELAQLEPPRLLLEVVGTSTLQARQFEQKSGGLQGGPTQLYFCLH